MFGGRTFYWLSKLKNDTANFYIKIIIATRSHFIKLVVMEFVCSGNGNMINLFISLLSDDLRHFLYATSQFFL